MIKIISAVIRTLQQIPFYFFILLKCVCVFVLIMVWASDLFFKILSDTPFSIYWIIPQMPFTPYILFFVLSVLYGLHLHKKHLFWATVFVSLEWLYLLLFYFVNGHSNCLI
ncbi:MAG: hypothetical protein E7014_05465 [Alphaproteobacteria bacterium]|nr:hypothetical protein [Alphaproteobacteria bacterium]